MAYKLKEAWYRVRCRAPGCPFVSEICVKENLMGAAKADIDSEAWKIARNLGNNQHDAIHGRKHALANPDVHKIRSVYESIGGVSAPAPHRQQRMDVRRFEKGDPIIVKGERAGTICEVVRGSARNEHRPEITYGPGRTFGAAGLFENKMRMANIVAAENDTLIAFYDMRDLRISDPEKARELYNEAMEDIFHLLAWFEDRAEHLEKQVAKLKGERAGRPSAGRAAPKRTAAAQAGRGRASR